MRYLSIIFIIGALLLTGCGGSSDKVGAEEENREAKDLLQGSWMDEESEELAFRVVGDTLYYPDSISMPAYFRILADSLALGSGTRYAIVKQTPHVFWFVNQNGDVIKLVKSDDAATDGQFTRAVPQVLTYTHQVKTDSVVSYDGTRYHWYIAINPTKYKVTKRTYNDGGLEVENTYYDNIMHISVFNGARKLYSSDFKKQMFSRVVKPSFLEEAILAKMEYSRVDKDGLHFNATLCIPDGASCYIAEIVVDFNGRMDMHLLEY